jgi:hypothetical protein
MKATIIQQLVLTISVGGKSQSADVYVHLAISDLTLV